MTAPPGAADGWACIAAFKDLRQIDEGIVPYALHSAHHWEWPETTLGKPEPECDLKHEWTHTLNPMTYHYRLITVPSADQGWIPVKGPAQMRPIDKNAIGMAVNAPFDWKWPETSLGKALGEDEELKYEWTHTTDPLVFFYKGGKPATIESSTAALPGEPDSSERRSRRANRWGDGMDAPNAGTRVFCGSGWAPDSMYNLPAFIDDMGAEEKDRNAILKTATAKQKFLRMNDIRILEEDVAHVLAYTADTPLYGSLTYAMRTNGTDRLLERMSTYINNLGKALAKLLPHQGRVFRGLSVILPRTSYVAGDTVCWQAFASSTKAQLETLTFLDKAQNRLTGTLVIIESKNGREVELMSQFPKEQEVLFTYNTFFKVKGWVEDDAGKRQLLPDFSGYNLDNLGLLIMEEN